MPLCNNEDDDSVSVAVIGIAAATVVGALLLIIILLSLIVFHWRSKKYRKYTTRIMQLTYPQILIIAINSVLIILLASHKVTTMTKMHSHKAFRLIWHLDWKQLMNCTYQLKLNHLMHCYYSIIKVLTLAAVSLSHLIHHTLLLYRLAKY